MSFDDLDGFDDFLTQAKASTSAWAKGLLSNPTGFVILDTETTGLDHRAEVCQIAVLRGDGEVLMNTLVKPRSPIPPDATRIHHITNEMVAAAPAFPAIADELHRVLKSAGRIVIYNAEYDVRILEQSAWLSGCGVSVDYVAAPECAMNQYARWYGDRNDYRGDFRWQKPRGGDHSALGDCRATLHLLKRMAGME